MKFFILLIFFSGCTKVHEVQKKNGLLYIPKLQPALSDPRVIDWKVGRKRESTVSKGIRFSSTIPRLSDDAKKILRQNGGIDSWLIKISRVKRGYDQNIGYFYMNLHSITRATKKFTVNLYYHSASVSKRFRLFHCPAFNHRLAVTDFSLKSRSIIGTNDLYVRANKRFPGKVSQLRFAPTVVSGGRSLVGTYHVDMALYNSKTKIRYSDWLSAEKALYIGQENAVGVASCLGIKEENTPLPESKMPSLRDLEIK